MDVASELIGSSHESLHLRKDEFWALREISFKLGRGKSLGLIGPNGSGKTTLLKIISGLIKQNTGIVKIRGRVAPLIALGAGFSPVLTGKENIYVNMSILGLTKKEVDKRFDAVIDFAEIGHAIDAPVRTYSSGMAARLGFSTAIHTDPDILLIDEVLAVGDIEFRGKCYRKLEELRKNQTAIILVSHNPEGILSVCDSACYLRNGYLKAFGQVEEVLNEYENDIFFPERSDNHSRQFVRPKKTKEESTGLDILSIFFRNPKGESIDFPLSGEPTILCVKCFSHRVIQKLCFKIAIQGISGEVLFMDNLNDGKSMDIQFGINELQLHLPYMGLIPGTYTAKIGLTEGKLFTLDAVSSYQFIVQHSPKNKNATRCKFFQPRSWEVLKDYQEN
jgi:lipopolysaccharide transport system ATP-binding protein